MCIGIFKKENFEIVNNPKDAEIIIINTCGFIESAKEEAINCILEMAEFKEKGNCKYLIAMGCLVQRYKSELEKALPEVDLFLSIDEYNNIWEKICNLINKEKRSINTLDYLKRVISTGNSTAYLKISEGCSNKCTYCAIPYIRGPYISRKMEDILEEANGLAEKGIKELIVIAQDTTKYGQDIYGRPVLSELLQKLCEIPQIKWIRFLYAYPESITDELISVVKNNKKICNYFDIPLQHFSDSVLKRMNRKSDSKSIEKTIEKIRKEIPEVILRTTFIVGFPGESEEDFFKLYEFVNKAKFEKLGVFKYSKEDGTPAAKLKEQIHHNTKKKRYNQIMGIAKQVSKQKLEKLIGKTYKVLIENKTFDNKYYIGRTYMDIPEEDGVIYIENNKPNQIGKFVDCNVTGIQEYDLIGIIK